MKAYHATGSNGTVLQVQDEQGNLIVDCDSVSEDNSAEINDWFERTGGIADWEDEPLAGDFSDAEVQEYVGA